MKPTLPIACLKLSVNDYGDWVETSAERGEPVFFSETVQALVDTAYEAGKADAGAEIERLNDIINTPQADDFLRATSTEAEHQRQRFGSDSDAGKTPAAAV